MDDIHHLDARFKKDQIDADKARQRADTERLRADQYRRSGNDGLMSFHLAAAEKLDAKARELDDDRNQAESDRSNIAARISDLEKQRDALDADHEQQKSAITNEINRLRGTSLSL